MRRALSVETLDFDPDRDRAIALTLSGHVQGVGFRPFVYRLANEYGIRGQVQNRLGEVEIIACGHPDALARFCRDLLQRAPPLSRPQISRQRALEPAVYEHFDIVASSAGAEPRVFVPPDFFMCDDCRRELRDPFDRRFQYPFINCTQCGPRYTLIESLPYDRANTSMRDFALCAACAADYLNPADRRFHAEPVACPACGPALHFMADGEVTADKPLRRALDSLRDGRIVAVKGVGGYHLMCDAQDAAAVARLRTRKHRPDKPLAVMFPISGGDGLDMVRRHATPDADEAALLASPLRPIVLLRKKTGTGIASNVAPGLGEIGALLPYSPLHQLLLDAFGRPLVATSGNISGEPVLTDNDEAATGLAPVADAFLQHSRRIVRPADDSVYRKIASVLRPLRIGRGAAPAELTLPWYQDCPTLAVGGQMKAAIALSWEDRIVVSPHIGEMDSPKSLAVLERLADDLQSLYKVKAERIVCDAHPAYTTHRWAHRQSALPVEHVWHHHAHASALAAEGGLGTQSLLFTWDGVGLGEDGSLWGGEALLGGAGHWQRVASLRPFRLPGADRAGREPWRSAAALLWECGQSWPDCPDRTGLAAAAWRAQLNCPQTTAAGRLFDAAAALVLGLNFASFEAAGPMQLEAICRRRQPPIGLPLVKDHNGIWRSDWELLLALLQDSSISAARRAEIFHSSLAHAILAQARHVRDERAVSRVGLCGGVFQNRVLSEEVAELLRNDDFEVVMPRQLPCNDAALCVGQAAEIAARAANG
ncbi:MAG: carbamoyltransferase HypF [Gammaproteobacteria bacterium]|nr:carbamoyltransferase HypF [Gammaproteobacteria bacterium]